MQGSESSNAEFILRPTPMHGLTIFMIAPGGYEIAIMIAPGGYEIARVDDF